MREACNYIQIKHILSKTFLTGYKHTFFPTACCNSKPTDVIIPRFISLMSTVLPPKDNHAGKPALLSKPS